MARLTAGFRCDPKTCTTASTTATTASPAEAATPRWVSASITMVDSTVNIRMNVPMNSAATYIW
jgi:hypothetical protein